MTSRIVRTEGLVLRNLRYGDTSRVATLLTLELGKVGVIGKGVREPRSPLGSSLELFARSEYVLYFRSGRDLQLLKSGDVLDDHRELHQATHRFVYASAAVEFVDRMLLEDEPAPALYALVLKVLARLRVTRASRAGEVFRAFQLRAASLLGYALLLDACLHCGSSLDEAALAPGSAGEAGAWLFRVGEGGALCPKCARGADVGYPVTVRALLRIRSMVRADGAAGAGRHAGLAVHERRQSARGHAEAAALPEPDGGTEPDPAVAAREVEADAREAAERKWVEALDRIVEDFLHYHVERYRGLRSLASGRP